MKSTFLKVSAIAFIVCGVAALPACGLFGGNKEEKYTEVVYHFNGGEPNVGTADGDGTMTTNVYEVNRADFKPVSVTKETWVLEGWYTDENFTDAFSGLPADGEEEVHLYAKWTDKITVTKENFKEYFSVNSRWNGGLTEGGAAVIFSFSPKPEYIIDPIRSTGVIEISATPKLGTWSGYTRSVTLNADDDYGYSDIAGVPGGTSFHLGSATLSYEVLTDEVELYLLHKDPIKVTLEANGGALDDDGITVNGGDTLLSKDLPAPVKDGYRFMGWYTDEDLTAEYENKIVTRAKSLYAKWAKEVTVTFDTLGGSEKQALVFLEGKYLDFGDKPARAGYGFMGWYTDEECTEAFEEHFATASVKLYAKWVPYRSVTFDLHGGEGAIEPFEVLNDTSINSSDLAPEPAKDGLVFKGWYTDGEYTHEYGGEPVTEDLTLHALWCYEYNGLKQGDLDEKISKFFDYDFSFEKKQIGNADAVVVHLSVSLKEKYKNFDFEVGLYVHGEFLNASGSVLGNFVRPATIRAASGGTYSEDYVSYKIDSVNIYEFTESVNYHFSCGWSTIYLPEGFEVD